MILFLLLFNMRDAFSSCLAKLNFDCIIFVYCLNSQVPVYITNAWFLSASRQLKISTPVQIFCTFPFKCKTRHRQCIFILANCCFGRFFTWDVLIRNGRFEILTFVYKQRYPFKIYFPCLCYKKLQNVQLSAP